MTSRTMMTNRATSSMIAATAEAASRFPFSMKVRTRTDATSVLPGRLPESSTREPYSLIPRAKESAAPAAIAGISDGRITRRNVVNRPAPSEADASSTSRSRDSRTGWTVRTTNGSVTKASARNTAIRVFATLTPSGDDGP
jgi:hypothetical protein